MNSRIDCAGWCGCGGNRGTADIDRHDSFCANDLVLDYADTKYPPVAASIADIGLALAVVAI